MRIREDVSLKEGCTTWKAGTWFSIWDCLTLDLEILVTILYGRINFVLHFFPACKVPSRFLLHELKKLHIWVENQG